MTVLNIPIFPVRDIHGAEIAMKRIPRLNFHHYLVVNELFCLLVGNAFDGRVMPAGAERSIIIEPDEFSQVVVCLGCVVKKTGHYHSGRIPAKKSCVSAEDDDTADMSAELGSGDGGTVCENLTTGDDPQLGGGLEGIIVVVMGGFIIVVNEGIERFARLHFDEIFAFLRRLWDTH